jgi:N-formylmaleamate deformylase
MRYCHSLGTLALLAMVPAALAGQTRSRQQDSTLDHFRHPAGTPTVAFGTLGDVRKLGEGPRTMVLISGLGFGSGIWTEFMERHRAHYTMYAVTLPGFGGTPPLAAPSRESRFAEIPWTRSGIVAIRRLLDRERIARVTIVAHWALATQIALHLALAAPERVEAVVLIGGALKSYYESFPGMLAWTSEERADKIERFGRSWFRTVTRRTWDDNNFMSYDYAVNPRRGLFLWREAQAPPLSVWVRYLLEFYSTDLTPRLRELKVPTLVVQPGFDDTAYYVEEPGGNYMRNLTGDSWRGAAERSDRLQFVTIPRSRLFVMFDQPEELDRVMASFLGTAEP